MAKQEDSWEENRKFVFDNIDKLGETLQGQYTGLGRGIEKLEGSFEKRLDKQSDDFNVQLLNITTKLESMKENDLSHIDERLDALDKNVTAINTKLIMATGFLVVFIPILIQVAQLSVDYFKN